MSIFNGFVNNFEKDDISKKIKEVKLILYGKEEKSKVKCINTKLGDYDKIMLVIWLTSDMYIEEGYISFNKENKILKINDINIEFNYDEFIKIYEYFNNNPEKKLSYRDITERSDIFKENRKSTQEYYTPKVCVDDIHKLMEEVISKEWRTNYTVWDSSCGTTNLTKDYKFNKLYLSTLTYDDIALIKNLKYNQGAEIFQYDFLDKNEIIQQIDEWNVPKSLKLSIKNEERIIFFINPPYEKDQYINFLKKIMNIKKKYYSKNELYICIISPIGYLSDYKREYEQFRGQWLNEFEHKDGIIFESNIFDNIKKFPLAFTIWKAKYNSSLGKFKYKIKDYKNNKVDEKYKEIYNSDYEIACKDWIKSTNIINTTKIIPVFKTHEEVLDIAIECDSKCLGYYVNNSNNIKQSEKYVFLMSGKYELGKGFFITEDNIKKVLSNFAARKIIITTSNKAERWKYEKDQYLKPNIDHKKYKEWEDDCIIYSILNKSACQVSLRDVEISCILEMSKKQKLNNNKKILKLPIYKDIYNHFFFMSKEQIYKLSQICNNEDIIKDCNLHGKEDRYIYRLLKDTTLSNEAKDVLDKAINLVETTFKERINSSINQINTWDAGWYQIRMMIKEIDINLMKDFDIAYKKLEQKLKPLVYELGFLNK